MNSFYVYILKCSDGSYYTGHTNDLEKRLAEHQNGSMLCYTTSRLPVKLVFVEEFDVREKAYYFQAVLSRMVRYDFYEITHHERLY